MIPIPMHAIENQNDAIEQIQAQDDGWVRLGTALSTFLHEAFPHTKTSTCVELGDAITALMCTGSDKQIARLQQYSQPPKPTPEMLMYLVEQRDQLARQLEIAEKGMDAVDKMVPGYSSIVEGAMIMPVREQLRGIEEQISKVQREIERESTPQPPTAS